ncbi:MAG: filamentous hemagglutinin N-terminal domain-containing protein, partial [Methylococcaceae bacterium]|nr:filamentous hemagglutinin N-terminal domain-containing protein [Methylococcaceae bacterium]
MSKEKIRLPPFEQKRVSKRIQRTAIRYRLVYYSVLGQIVISSVHAEVAPSALPSQAQVLAGQVSIDQHDATMTITQGSQKGILNWESFNIGRDARVDFQQPNVQSVTLNRVVSHDPSQIYGQLTANGQVYLVNPNGVLFAPGSKVDVGGIVASTQNISNDNFLAGKNQFQRDGAEGSIVNQGEIKAHHGGTVALLSPHVSNQGLIVAQQGDVVLAGGDQVTLQAGANGHLQIAVDPATINSLIENKQLIQADGGQVIMTSQAANAIYSNLVSNTGIIQARSIGEQQGHVLLKADEKNGEVQIGGLIDVSGQQLAGQVQVSGHSVKQTGEIRANSAEAVGGQIKVLGSEIQLQANSQILAEGASGGGVVQIGALKDNALNEVQADRISLAETASISVDATQNGNAGRITIIADLNKPHSETQIKGNLSARGGGLGGNGGFIETSAAILGVSSTSRVRASAARGKSGEWLLDPADVTISSTDLNYTNSSDTYTPDSGVGTVTVNASTLTSALNAGTSIAITTTNAGTSGLSNGDITLSSPITTAPSGGVLLTLTADRNIYINANITSSISTLGLTLNATGGAISGSGNINTNGGSLTLNVGNGSGTLSGVISGLYSSVTK